MAVSETLWSAWSKARRYLEALDQAVDYDRLKEQRRWIAGLEARIARVEQGLASGQESSALKAPET